MRLRSRTFTKEASVRSRFVSNIRIFTVNGILGNSAPGFTMTVPPSSVMMWTRPPSDSAHSADRRSTSPLTICGGTLAGGMVRGKTVGGVFVVAVEADAGDEDGGFEACEFGSEI